MPHIKIVATIGPATCNKASLLALAQAGFSVARLNGSHADLAWHRDAISLLRETLPHIPILLDIPGRKIRTKTLALEPRFQVGDRVVLTTDPDDPGTERTPVNYDRLHEDLQAGNIILADDGTLRFVVERIEGRNIVCIAQTAGVLRSRKGINVPFVKIKTETVTERDRQMVAFAKENGVDFIGISFVESATHVKAIKKLVGGPMPCVLAKVENQGGLDHLDEIVEIADAIMIDRGDLSVETSLAATAIHQKRIIASANRHGKPVIVATEMLHSMIESDTPTKAEVADITNAVLDGCSATMLSGETAVGRFPEKAVSTMREILETATGHIHQTRATKRSAQKSPPQAMEDAAALILSEIPITKIVAVTRSGYAARMLAARSVSQPILAISDDPALVRSFNLFAGVEGVLSLTPFPADSSDYIYNALRQLHTEGKLVSDDLVLVVSALYPYAGARMNTIQVHRVGVLQKAFQWKA